VKHVPCRSVARLTQIEKNSEIAYNWEDAEHGDEKGATMTDTISASEANRNFSAILRRVQQGDELVITTHGRPIARLIPYELDDRAAEELKANLLARLRERPLAHLGNFTRSMAYEDIE
jgi:prevent-host-death family protein